MKVSLNIIKKLVDFELPSVDELVAKINQQLGQVEEVIDLTKKYEGAVIVRVKSTEKHPDADRLTVCKVDDGGAIADLERDEDGYVQVVCGAPNVHADMWAVWLPPRATVPSSFDEDEPFVLDARKLRGVMSNGMLAAGDELAINSDHDGIIEITEADLPPELDGRGLAPGQSFAELFGLDDTIIDIENKMFTHRPDCFGQLGVAREISAILGGLPADGEDIADMRFANPDWYWLKPTFASADGLKLNVANEAPHNVSRFMAVALQNVTIAPSPLWLQCQLVAMGSKSINNVVDATNYIMLITAQPTHAYDYDKLRGNTINARMARDGEMLTLLNGKTYKLTADDIVIADGEAPIGLAGIMGGSESEVMSETKNVVLEVATFDMYAVRKTAMRHGVFTDALTRFNKGQSSLQNDRVLARLITMMRELARAEQASAVYDLLGNSTKLDAVSLSGEMHVTAEFINDRLGSDLSVDQISGLLRRANFASYPAEDDGQALMIAAPFWRTDIELPEDIVEEVGRLYDFDNLPRELPRRSSAPAPKNAMRETKQRIRESLSRAGANEVLSYSFVHENVLKRAGQDTEQAFKLSNALSPDLQYFRLSVLPSLLDKVHMNIKAGYDEFVLFEIGKAHNKKYHANDDDGLPREIEMVDAVYTNKKSHDGAPYYHVRRLVTQLAHELGLSLVFKPIIEAMDSPLTAPFDLARSALVETRQGDFVGIVGELRSSVRKQFKLPDYTAAMSLDTASIRDATSNHQRSYTPLSRFPSTSQDISIKASTDVTYQQVYHTASHALAERADGVDIIIEPVSVYRADDADDRTTTLHITFTHYDRTLTDADIKPLMDHLASVLLAEHGAERV